MKKTNMYTLSFLALFLTMTVTGSAGDKTSLSWKSFNDGLTEAKKFDKKILVDVYTDWCGWCKKMDKEVYVNSDVAQYLVNSYVVIKLDAESGDQLNYADQKMSEMELAHGFGISSYPTTIFLKSNGDPITLLPGYLPPKKFIDVLKFIGEDHYLTMKFDEYLAKKK